MEPQNVQRFDTIEDALSCVGAEDDRAGLIINETNKFAHFDRGANIYDMDYYDSFFASAPYDGKDKASFVVGEGASYPKLEVTHADAPEKSETYLVIPSSKFTEALQDRQLRSKMLAVALLDDEVAHYICDPISDNHASEHGVSEAMFQFADYKAKCPSISEDWSKKEEDVLKVANRLASFSEKGFQQFRSEYPETKTSEYGDELTGYRRSAYLYFATLKPVKESDLSRGIAKTILSKDYDTLHQNLDGFVRGEKKAIQHLEELGKSFKKDAPAR